MSAHGPREPAPSPVSAFAPQVTSTVERLLGSMPDVVILHRLTRAAGRRDWYVVRTLPELRPVLARGGAGDSFSIFLRPELPLRGPVDPSFVVVFERLLAGVEVSRSEVILGEALDDDPELHDVEGWSPHERDEARQWLKDHWGRRAVAGLHPDIVPPGRADVMTVYVPGEDGEVHPGVY